MIYLKELRIWLLVGVALWGIGAAAVYAWVKNPPVIEGVGSAVQYNFTILHHTKDEVKRNIYATLDKKTKNNKPASAVKSVKKINPKHQIVEDRPKTPIAGFEYVGYLERHGRNEAYVINGEEMYVVAQGDALTSRLYVINVQREVLELRYEPQGSVFVLEMSGNGE
ncbi:MAG: hypothetical protein HUJ29_07820 [Gammaproteobacteria bacterium]|nr:hypothetical protein [Gammaproteobacteria bacterium]